MTTETILIVDDSIEMQDILKDYILLPMGYHVLTASDGMEGLDMAMQFQPDLIFLDMNMPRMDGLEMLAALHQMNCYIPVIFMTVYGSERVIVEAFRLGACDCLNKPFKVEEVRSILRRVSQRARQQREIDELNRTQLTTETVHVTVTTLSHYLNNFLTSLKGGLVLLEEYFEQESPDDEMLDITHESLSSAFKIQEVMKVLLETSSIDFVPYIDSVPMINIEPELDQEVRNKPAEKGV